MVSNIVYLCDRKQCENCSYPLCKRTFDISHAKNFVLQDGFYVEQEKEGKSDGDGFERVSEVGSSDSEPETK